MSKCEPDLRSPYPWFGGKSSVALGDCRELMATIPDATFDAMVSDPPFGTDVPRDGYGRRQVYGGNAVHIANDSDLTVMAEGMKAAHRVLKPNAWAAVFCSPKNRRGAEDACIAAGFEIKGEVVWDKKAPGLGAGIRYQHETILLCGKGKVSGHASLFSVLAYSVERANRPERHPHEKPVGLLRQLVAYVSDPGGLVVDPFAGIGSSLVASVLEGRVAWGCEVEPKYHALASKRLASETSRPSLFRAEQEQPPLAFSGEEAAQ